MIVRLVLHSLWEVLALVEKGEPKKPLVPENFVKKQTSGDLVWSVETDQLELRIKVYLEVL